MRSFQSSFLPLVHPQHHPWSEGKVFQVFRYTAPIPSDYRMSIRLKIVQLVAVSIHQLMCKKAYGCLCKSGQGLQCKVAVINCLA